MILGSWLRRVGAAVAALVAVLAAPIPAYADQTRDAQWYLTALQVAQAHQITKGDGVLVAVVDTGYEDHPDLEGAFAGGVDTVKPDDKLIDTDGHGTAMAGIIAGRGRSGSRGVLGIAPASRILAARPADDLEFAEKGIDWAVEHGAKVINMSFAFPDTERLHGTIRKAAAADVVLVSSVGNTGDKDNKVEFPAAYPEVIGVGATDRKGKVAKFSQHGDQVDLAAPGVDIETAALGGRYRTTFGTSNASAVVAGAAALIRAKYPDLTAQQVVDRLIGTADDRGDKGRDDFYGNGSLDLMAALTAPQPAPSTSPTPAPVAGQTSAGRPVDSGMGVTPLIIIGGGLVLLVVAILAVSVIMRKSRE